jgi:hypothetical protein
MDVPNLSRSRARALSHCTIHNKELSTLLAASCHRISAYRVEEHAAQLVSSIV